MTNTRDINGDGQLDLITETAFGGGLFIFTGRGDGTFRDASKLEGLQGPPVADLNGDEMVDIVTPHIFSEDISVLLAR
jgi:hypothetical protein